MNSFRPEVHLLLDCARTCLDAERRSRIKRLISKDINWTYLLSLARGHRVMPLLYRTLNSTCSDAVPKEILQEVQQQFYANAGRNLFLTKELVKVVQLLREHGIPSIPYKGPVLAALVYGNLGLREFGDLDILVGQREYENAQHLLFAQGYELTKEFDCESTLVHGSGTFALDLHKGMTGCEFTCPLTFQYLSGRLQHIMLAGNEIPTLSPGDTLLMLAIQITKDSGSHYLQLAKICDMAELLRVYPELDVARVLRQAGRLGGERMLLYSLRLAHSLIGAVLPQEIVREMRFHRALDALVECAQQQLFDGGDRSVSDQRTLDQFRWRIRERLRDKLYPYYLRYVTDVIIPSELERRLLPLPTELSFLHYFIRPVRLLGKHGLRHMSRVYRTNCASHKPIVDSGRNRKEHTGRKEKIECIE